MRRLKQSLLLVATLLAVAGCKAKQENESAKYAREQGPASGAGGAEVVRTAYDECRGKAKEEALLLLACSDQAIGALLAHETEGRDALARDFKSLGDALIASAESKASVSIRVFAADRVVRYSLARVSLPDCIVAEKGTACTAARAALRQGVMSEAVSLQAADTTGDDAVSPFGGYRAPTCPHVRATANADAAMSEFESEFPTALKDEKLVEARQLSAAQLRPIVGYLACLAARSNFGPEVAETSLWLFSSKHNGARAHTILVALAKERGPDAEAAAGFAEQIDGYLSSSGEAAN